MHTNDTNKKHIEIVYAKECYILNGIFYDIHNKIGRFCREKQYADELEKEFISKKINYEREYNLKDIGESVSGNIVDFIIDNKILVDLKAKKFITKDDYYQMLRYLKSSDMKLGLIVNFRNTYVKPKRIINL